MQLLKYRKVSDVLRAAWKSHIGGSEFGCYKYICIIVEMLAKQGEISYFLCEETTRTIEEHLSGYYTWASLYRRTNNDKDFCVLEYTPEVIEAKKKWLFNIIDRLESVGA